MQPPVAGLDALRPKRKGRRSKLSKLKESKFTKIETDSNNSEYLKQLEDENLKLRIEVALKIINKGCHIISNTLAKSYDK